MELDVLVEKAIAARERAYAPYSQFAVGVALLTRAGPVFTGCNVENVSFGLTQCAERGAISTAVAAGFRTFEGLVIVTGASEPTSPCGACRQVLAEFCADLEIVSCTVSGKMWRGTLNELLPRARTGIDPVIVPHGT